MSEELKPCQICGGSTVEIEPAGMIWKGTGGYSDPQYWRLLHWGQLDKSDPFLTCKVEMRHRTEEKLIAAWNQRAKPVVKALVFDKYGEAKAGGAKYCIYESGSQGLWNCVCYPHEDVQYRIAEGVSRDEAVKLANEDQTRRVLACLEG